MLLPSGVAKGSGVRAGLAALRISPHSAVGVGDAENDHALLQTCELGVAVANAVPALADHADVRRERRFHFRTPAGRTGAGATILRQFVGELERCGPAGVCHHAAGHDFSRWTRDVLADPVLAERVHTVERETPHDAEAARAALVDAIGARYGIGSNRS